MLAFSLHINFFSCDDKFIVCFSYIKSVSLSCIYISKGGKHWGVYNMLSMSITTMVLKRLKFSCPTNRKKMMHV